MEYLLKDVSLKIAQEKIAQEVGKTYYGIWKNAWSKDKNEIRRINFQIEMKYIKKMKKL